MRGTKPVEPERLVKSGARMWTTGDLCITVTLTVTSCPPRVRGLDSVKVRRYRATRRTDDGRTVEVATATSFHDIRCRIARWRMNRDDVQEGMACKHGHEHDCGLCHAETQPKCEHGNNGHCEACRARKR